MKLLPTEYVYGRGRRFFFFLSVVVAVVDAFFSLYIFNGIEMLEHV